MKQLAVLSFLLVFGGILSNCDLITNVDTPNHQMEDDRPENLNKVLAYCVNNNFPPHSGINWEISYSPCQQGSPIPDFPAVDAAKLWNNHVTSPVGTLGFLACSCYDDPHSIQGVNVTKSQSGNYPYITWGFKFSHYYVIKRRINSGSWVVLDTLMNCYTGELDSDCGDADNHGYVDSSLNLSTLSGTVEYAVYTGVFNTTVVSNNAVSYEGEVLAVSISGPTSMTTLQTGLFTANVTGGESPYSFSWQKYQYCDDLLSETSSSEMSGTESIPCGRWRSVGSDQSTLSTGGFIPEIIVKVTVTDDDSNISTDTHSVVVTLP